jgi:hypothetical protein
MMEFWHTALDFFWREESLLVVLMSLGLTFILYHFHKEERRSIVNTLSFFLACLFGQFISSLLHAMMFTAAASTLREVFVIGGGIIVPLGVAIRARLASAYRGGFFRHHRLSGMGVGETALCRAGSGQYRRDIGDDYGGRRVFHARHVG